jgi:hypothetical protein
VRARRLVGSSLSLMLVATVLVAVGVGSPGRAQTTRVKKQSDPGNSPKEVKDRGPKVLPVVGKPEPLGGVLEDPKGDGKTPDWFLKTDEASRAAALAAQKVTLAPSSLSVQTDKSAPGGLTAEAVAADALTRALVPELSGGGAAKKSGVGLSKAARRAARIAEGDPVVVEGQDAARTVRGVSSKRLAAEPVRPAIPVDGPLSKAGTIATGSVVDAKAPMSVDSKPTTTVAGVSTLTGAPQTTVATAQPVAPAVGPVVAVTGGPGVAAGPQDLPWCCPVSLIL